MKPNSDVHALKDPDAQLERKYIHEFLWARGYDPGALDLLPDDDRRRLLEDASVYAAGKLAEVQSRAHFVRGMHPEQ